MFRLVRILPVLFATATGVCIARAAEMKSPAAFTADLLKYEKEVLTKLEAKDFNWLDHEAEQLQKTREHTQIGAWKLRQFANVLSKPLSEEEEHNWVPRLGLLQAWDEKSKSAFSASMLGAGYVSYAWSFRGSGYAKGVTKDGWENFRRELEKGAPLLEDSFKRDPKNPDIYRQLLTLGLSLGWPQEKMDGILKQGVAIAPDYLENYMVMAIYKLPRWYGKEGDWQRFINSIPDLAPGDDGSAMYASAVVMTWTYTPQSQIFGEDRADRVSWKKMKHGFEVLRQRYPESANLLNREAFFAGMAQDLDTLAADLKILDEKKLIDVSEWYSPASLEMARKAVSERK